MKQAKLVLNGQMDRIQDDLKLSMQTASATLQYERAAIYRDQIQSLKDLDFNQEIIENGDVIAIYKCDNLASVKVLSFVNWDLNN